MVRASYEHQTSAHKLNHHVGITISGGMPPGHRRPRSILIPVEGAAIDEAQTTESMSAPPYRVIGGFTGKAGDPRGYAAINVPRGVCRGPLEIAYEMGLRGESAARSAKRIKASPLRGGEGCGAATDAMPLGERLSGPLFKMYAPLSGSIIETT